MISEGAFGEGLPKLTRVKPCLRWTKPKFIMYGSKVISKRAFGEGVPKLTLIQDGTMLKIQGLYCGYQLGLPMP